MSNVNNVERFKSTNLFKKMIVGTWSISDEIVNSELLSLLSLLSSSSSSASSASSTALVSLTINSITFLLAENNFVAADPFDLICRDGVYSHHKGLLLENFGLLRDINSEALIKQTKFNKLDLSEFDIQTVKSAVTSCYLNFTVFIKELPKIIRCMMYLQADIDKCVEFAQKSKFDYSIVTDKYEYLMKIVNSDKIQ